MSVIDVRYNERTANVAAELIPVQPWRRGIDFRDSVVGLGEDVVSIEFK